VAKTVELQKITKLGDTGLISKPQLIRFTRRSIIDHSSIRRTNHQYVINGSFA
jgi:hypothetical protein